MKTPTLAELKAGLDSAQRELAKARSAQDYFDAHPEINGPTPEVCNAEQAAALKEYNRHLQLYEAALRAEIDKVRQ